MNRALFLTLIFCSVINAAPAQPPFLGADSVDVVVKEVAQIPESSQSFTVSSELFFSFFKKSQAFENISQCECTQTKECSKLLTEHCLTLSQAKQIRKTSIATFKLSFPEENLSCAIKLMTRKVGSQLFTTFTIFVPQKNAPEITQVLINFCNAAIPRLSLMQKHSGKVYSGVFVLGVGLYVKWYNSPKQKQRRKNIYEKEREIKLREEQEEWERKNPEKVAAAKAKAEARHREDTEKAEKALEKNYSTELERERAEEIVKREQDLTKLRPNFLKYIEVKKTTLAASSQGDCEACFCGEDFVESEEQWSTKNCICRGPYFHEVCILRHIAPKDIHWADRYRPVTSTKTTCPTCSQ